MFFQGKRSRFKGLDFFNASVPALQHLDRLVGHWDDILVYLFTQALDQLWTSTRRAWELHLRESDEFPTFVDLSNFIEAHIRVLDAIYAESTSGGGSSRTRPTDGARVRSAVSHFASSTRTSSALNLRGTKAHLLTDDCPTY